MWREPLAAEAHSQPGASSCLGSESVQFLGIYRVILERRLQGMAEIQPLGAVTDCTQPNRLSPGSGGPPLPGDPPAAEGCHSHGTCSSRGLPLPRNPQQQRATRCWHCRPCHSHKALALQAHPKQKATIPPAPLLQRATDTPHCYGRELLEPLLPPQSIRAAAPVTATPGLTVSCKPHHHCHREPPVSLDDCTGSKIQHT